MFYILDDLFALVNWKIFNPSRNIICLLVTYSIGSLSFLHTSHIFFSIYIILKNFYMSSDTVDKLILSFPLIQFISWLIDSSLGTILCSNP